MTEVQGKNYALWALGSFVILSLFGVVLRLMFVYPSPGLNYTYILHAHSHFAFAGWIFLSLALLIVRTIFPGKSSPPYKKIFLLTLISAFGMLISFSLQGYKAVSITFSTLLIVAGYWFTYQVWKDKNLKLATNQASLFLLKSSLLFLCLSSLGPFTLGPLMASGMKGTPFYNDAIYFYLHFQMNGWMTLAALAIFFNRYFEKDVLLPGPTFWLKVFAFSVVPLYFLFTLWSNPPVSFRIIAIIGAILNFVSWVKILQYLNKQQKQIPYLVKIALLALTLKIFFQVLAGFPGIGSWVFSNRSLIIGYIHLLSLGVLMPIILNSFRDHNFLPDSAGFQKVAVLFVLAVIVYLVLLFIQPLLALFGVLIPNFQLILLVVAICFLLLGLALFKMAYSFK